MSFMKIITLIRKKAILILVSMLISSNIFADELLVGVASIDITPKLPVALDGQFHLRIARTADTPLTANVIALESKTGSKENDIAIMITADVVGIPNVALIKIREIVKGRISGLDVNKIFVSAVHTHTAPVLVNSSAWGYSIPSGRCYTTGRIHGLFHKPDRRSSRKSVE
jgi:hypothetical protein